MRPQCELCGYVITEDKHFSLADCNDTGIGVVLHRRCEQRLVAARRAGWDVVKFLTVIAGLAS